MFLKAVSPLKDKQDVEAFATRHICRRHPPSSPRGLGVHVVDVVGDRVVVENGGVLLLEIGPDGLHENWT